MPQILVKEDVKARLDGLKLCDDETYNSVIKRILPVEIKVPIEDTTIQPEMPLQTSVQQPTHIEQTDTFDSQPEDE